MWREDSAGLWDGVATASARLRTRYGSEDSDSALLVALRRVEGVVITLHLPLWDDTAESLRLSDAQHSVCSVLDNKYTTRAVCVMVQ